MTAARTAGRLLAERHEPTDAVGGGLIDFEEAPRAGDWTLRSALVRYAQPEPTRAAAVLHLVRRLNAVLRPLGRAIDAQAVWCDRAVAADAATGSVAPEPLDPYPDGRVTDVARLVRGDPDVLDAVVAGYEEVSALTEDERTALPLLVVALDFDQLAETLVEWAPTAPATPPNDAVDAACRSIHAELDALGIPEETGPPGGGRRRG